MCDEDIGNLVYLFMPRFCGANIDGCFQNRCNVVHFSFVTMTQLHKESYDKS